MHGFEPANGHCFRMTDPVDHTEALSQCWAGWQLHDKQIHLGLSAWLEQSMEWIGGSRLNSPLIWLPFRRPNKASIIQKPVWTWNSGKRT